MVRRKLTNRPELTNFLFASGVFVSFSKAEPSSFWFVNFVESELQFDSGSLISEEPNLTCTWRPGAWVMDRTSKQQLLPDRSLGQGTQRRCSA